MEERKPFRCTAHREWPCEECMAKFVEPAIADATPAQDADTVRLVCVVLDRQLALAREAIAHEAKTADQAYRLARKLEGELGTERETRWKESQRANRAELAVAEMKREIEQRDMKLADLELLAQKAIR